MRLRVLLFIFVLAAGLLPAFAQEHPLPPSPPGEHEERREAHGGEEDHGPGTPWKVANFAILAGLLGYFIYKKGGPFFQSRTEEIRKGLDDAARLKADSDARLAEMERRMAHLDAEVQSLRTAAREEISAEGERLRAEAEQQMNKVRAHAETEIASAGKAARQELKAYSAELALDLAEQKIRGRSTPAVQEKLLDSFLDNLSRQPRPGREAR